MTALESVSVVIPAYNQGKFLRESINSALAQTHPPAEIIVVDDGSTDDTREQLKTFGDRVTYMFQQNAGPSAARNAGVRRARGEWVAFLDADDLWHRQKLEIQLSAVQQRKDVALVGSHPALTMADVLAPTPKARELTVRDFLLSLRMSPTSALIRPQQLLSVGGFDETIRFAEDRDVWLRMAVKFRCLLVESPCCCYRRHDAQTTSGNAYRMFSDYERVLNKFFSANPGQRKFRRLAMSYLYFDTSVAYFEEGNRVAALQSLSRSFAYRPITLGDGRARPLTRLRFARRVLQDELRQRALHSGLLRQPARYN
jgi:glycosyltransferase involved in cell wall biosynthesis